MTNGSAHYYIKFAVSRYVDASKSYGRRNLHKTTDDGGVGAGAQGNGWCKSAGVQPRKIAVTIRKKSGPTCRKKGKTASGTDDGKGRVGQQKMMWIAYLE